MKVKNKHPNYHVTRIATIAGKKWAELSPERKQKYIDLANEEKKRRSQNIVQKKINENRRSKMKQPWQFQCLWVLFYLLVEFCNIYVQ